MDERSGRSIGARPAVRSAPSQFLRGTTMIAMQRTPLDDMACSLARTLDVAGEWWTPLIVRDVWFGARRFDDIQRDLGLSRKALTSRLRRLVEEGVMEREQYQEN